MTRSVSPMDIVQKRNQIFYRLLITEEVITGCPEVITELRSDYDLHCSRYDAYFTHDLHRALGK